MDQRNLSQYLTAKICVNHKKLSYSSLHGRKYVLSPPSSLMKWTKMFKHLKEFGYLISSYFKSTDMSTRELSVPCMVTYTWSFPCFSWFLFPVKTEILIPGENSRICAALFERLQHCKVSLLCFSLLLAINWSLTVSVPVSTYPAAILMPTSPGFWSAL